MNDVPSTAAQIILTIVPIVGIVMGSTVIFFYLMWSYRHKKLLIEKNLVKKTEFDFDSFSLFAGLILLSIGGSLVTFFLIKEGVSYGVLSGLIPLSIGISLIVFFIIRRKLIKNDRDK
jgi:hypothetical protein